MRVVAVLSSPPPSTWEYHDLVVSWMQGRGLSIVHEGATFRSFYAGLPYLALTAALYAIAPPGLVAVQLAQCALSAVTAVSAYHVGRRFFAVEAALCGALLAGLHPGLAYYDVRNLHPLGFDAACGVLTLLAVFRALERPEPARALTAGVALGLSGLQRGSLLPFAVVAIAVVGRRCGMRAAALVLASFGACLLPWIARNAALHGRLVMLTTTGEHLWIGNFPGSDGGNWTRDARMVLRLMPPDLAARLRDADESERDAVFREAVRRQVLADPGGTLRRVALKALRFWWWTPATGQQYPRPLFAIYAAYYVFVILMCAHGARDLGGGRAERLLAGAYVGSVWAVHALLYAELRHRWAIEPVLLILAGAGVARLLRLGTASRAP